MSGKLFALVVGIDNYASSPLKGCVNDARAVAGFLEHRVREGLELRMLLDEAADRDGFLTAFRQHLGQAGPEDQALFFFAGHGSQEDVPPELAHLEPLDGKNETLVLHDSREPGGWDLADKELAVLLAELGAGHVLVILDSCHSGDATRVPEDEPGVRFRRRPTFGRQRPIESYFFYEPEMNLPWKLESGQVPMLPEGAHVLLSACASSELAREKTIHGTRRGLFSYQLIERLANAHPNTTYRELYKRTRTLVRLDNRLQTPQAEGDLTGRVLDGELLERPRVFHVRPIPEADGHWRLDAGQVHGMVQGTQVAVFPVGTQSFDDLEKALAILIVVEAETANSRLGPVKGEMPRFVDTLPAVLVEHPLPPLRVHLRGESELLESFRESIRDSPCLGEAEREDATVEVRFEGSKVRVVKYGTGDLLPPRHIEWPEELLPLVGQLEHMARWLAVYHLEQHGGELEQEITLDIFQWKGPPETFEDPPDYSHWSDEPASPQETRRFTIRLENRGQEPIYFALLAVSEDLSVSVVRRGQGLLEGRRTLWVRPFDGISASVPSADREQGITRQQDLLLLIASEVEVDFGLLEQPELARSDQRDPDPDRSPVTGTLEAFMRRINRSFRVIDAEEETGHLHRWITHRSLIDSLYEALEIIVRGGESTAGSGLRFLAPDDFQATIRPRSPWNLPPEVQFPAIPPAIADTLRPFALAGNTFHNTGLSFLEISSWSGELSGPLRIEGVHETAADEELLALLFDGERLLWATLPAEEPRRACELVHLPPPGAEGRSLWLLFFASKTSPGEAPRRVPGKPVREERLEVLVRLPQPLGLTDVPVRTGQGLESVGISPEEIRAAIADPSVGAQREGFFGRIFGSLFDNWRAMRYLDEGDDHFWSNRFREAIDSYQKALEIFQKLGSKSGISTTLGALGNVYHAVGEYQMSLECHQVRLEILRTIPGTWRSQGRALSGIGNAYLGLAEVDKAIAHFEEHLELARLIEDRTEETTALGSLGWAWSMKEDFERALEYARAALLIDEELGEARLIHHSLLSLANIHTMKGEFQSAIRQLERALRLAREELDERFIGLTLANTCDVYTYIGDYEHAVELVAEAVKIFQRIEDRHSLGSCLVKLGSAHFNLRQLDPARESLQAGIEETSSTGDRRSQAVAWHYLGHVHLVEEDDGGALEAYKRSLEIRQTLDNPHVTAVSLTSIALVHRLREEYDEAIVLYRQAEDLVADNPMSRGNILNNLGMTLVRAERFAAAEVELGKTLELWETLRENLGPSDRLRTLLFDGQFLTYGILQLALVKQGRPEAALETAERGRARSLVDLLGRELVGDHDLDIDVEPPDLEEIQRISRTAKARIVFYSTIQEEVGLTHRLSEIYIWVVDDQHVQFRKSSAVHFARLAELEREDPLPVQLGTAKRPHLDLRKIDGEETPPDVSAAYRRILHDALIAPIGEILSGDDRPIVFVPDSYLFLVPFAALLDEDHRPLIESHRMLMAPSIQSLALMMQRRENLGDRGGEVLVVGNPTMPRLFRGDGSELVPQPLEYAEDEAERVASLYGETALIQDAATKEAVLARMPRCRIVHLATHAFFDEAVETSTGAVVLAGETPKEALLVPDDVLALELDAELVTLSACSTGHGRFTQEGLIGLFRAFLLAGTASVIVSLWPVYDLSTAFFMTRFYRELQGGLSKERALQAAILATREQWPHYEHWAPFVLIGETS